ncbi:MAG TPA: serine/threonine-protein kinase [Polyangiaceae bacterium]|nr:serine/threonine-protein kinase [Polyangiaceae bacterium]
MDRELALPGHIGRYRIERLLGRGAMGRVLLGRDLVLDREVAVKLLRDDLSVDPDQHRALVDRMRHEAKACARVSHPNIVALFDMGEDPALGLYLVFEYAEGTTLKERIARGPVPPELGARIAREIGGALSTAHGSGVLHRDVKPENIILTVHGSKVADFGIARVPNSTLTKDHGLLGTPAYSSPESIAHGEFSPQSDQFSLAATLYEALSQKRAFPGDDAVTVANRIQTDEPPPIARACGLDPHVDGVLARALSKDPEERFPSAGEFGDALAEALGQGTRRAMPTIPDRQHRLTHAERATSSTRSAVGGAAVGAMLAIAVFELTTGLRDREREAAPAPARAETAPPKAPAVAWLAPAPRERPRASSSASSRHANGAQSATPNAKPAASSAPAPSDAAPPAAVSASPSSGSDLEAHEDGGP